MGQLKPGLHAGCRFSNCDTVQRVVACRVQLPSIPVVFGLNNLEAASIAGRWTVQNEFCDTEQRGSGERKDMYSNTGTANGMARSYCEMHMSTDRGVTWSVHLCATRAPQ